MARQAFAPPRQPRPPVLLPAFPHAVVGSLPAPVANLVVVLAALAGGAALGWLAVARGPVPAAGLLIGMLGLVIVVADARAGLWGVVAVVTLLPFAVIPVRFGLTLTLLEAALIGTTGIWLLGTVLRRDRRVAVGLPGAWIFLLLMVTLFAFLLGIENAYTTQTFHDYAKFVLAMLLVYVVWNTTRSLDDARRLVTVLLAGTAAASALGLALYAGGPGLTMRVLARLIPYGYPSSKIVRYIEDNPAKAMRLTSTSVDPNSFGGLLAVVFVLACAQAIARRRLVSRWITVPAAGLSGVALLLTQSRGAWVGAAAGLAVLTLLRYRWLIAPGTVLAVLVLLVGLGGSFLNRLYLGLALQDPATKLRLREYANALAIIREHPLFGVGFGAAPSIDLQTGVSSIYLTIAERMGILGILAFALAVGAVLAVGFRYWRRHRNEVAGDLELGLLGALAAALVVGVFDHYFFNITFPHMAALFWMICGLILALARPPGQVDRQEET